MVRRSPRDDGKNYEHITIEMISIPWLFAGILVGLLIVSVFHPPVRDNKGVPLPGNTNRFYTGTGCVKFKSKEVPCTDNTTSLNLVASQHK
jgi:hypothetical protein